MSDKSLDELFTDITGDDSVTTEQEQSESRFRGEETETRPTTTVICPECNNDTAYYEMKQIRAADESETRFFECTDCGYKWREDDH
jgi:DNA-directed RNA polymerase subunit M